MSTEPRLHQLWHGYNKASYPFDELLRLEQDIFINHICTVGWVFFLYYEHMLSPFGIPTLVLPAIP